MKGLKLVLRQWGRNRLFTFLNIIGLAIGISASWIVFRIVNYEFSFNQNHPDKESVSTARANPVDSLRDE